MTQDKQRTLTGDAEDTPEKNPHSMDDRLSAISRMASDISDKLGEVMERVDEIHDMLSGNHAASNYGSGYDELNESEE